MTLLTFFENIFEQSIIFKCNKNIRNFGTVTLEFEQQENGSLQCSGIKACYNGSPCEACEKCVEYFYNRVVACQTTDL